MSLDSYHMPQAIELALRCEVYVEPNPMFGCVIAHDADVVGIGWHRRYGGPHAEIEALAIAGDKARGATMYVTLEPCCHQGKTPPCTQAIIAAGVGRIVVAVGDPFPEVQGGGRRELRKAGIEIGDAVCIDEARDILAPYLMLVEKQRPWVIGKWAMTLDGKIATHTGDSKWISSPASRSIVHRLRGRVDAILVGRGTAVADDPSLTARPEDADVSDEELRNWPPRVATRIVLDSQAQLPLESQLVQTAGERPVLVAATADAPAAAIKKLQAQGVEVWQSSAGAGGEEFVQQLLEELGRRRMTNVLVEGGGEVLGTLRDADLIDEAHVFVGPQILGGGEATAAIAGRGEGKIAGAPRIDAPKWQQVGPADFYVHGRIVR
mgnify:CR=1 FL=1